MSDVLYLMFSLYVIFTIFDIVKADSQYDEHKFLEFDKPTRSWFSFFIIHQKWSIGSIVVLVPILWCFFSWAFY